MTVHLFKSTYYGAPQSTPVAGAVVGILDGCLVNGFGSQTASITCVDSVATVSVPVAHGLDSGVIMRVSGANQEEYNGDFKITVLTSTSFSYPVVGTPVSPATGTITSKVAPAGWLKPFSATNRAAYKQGAGCGRFLRVNDTTTGNARAVAFEDMTSLDETVFNRFPTEAQQAGGYYLFKSTSGSQAWFIVATEKAFFSVLPQSWNHNHLQYFGDFKSGIPGDVFNTIFIAPYYEGDSQGCLFEVSSALAGVVEKTLCRAFHQEGIATQANLSAERLWTGRPGSGGLDYPSPSHGGLVMSPYLVFEPKCERGVLPGVWFPHHYKPLAHKSTFEGQGELAGKKFLAIDCGWVHQNQIFVEISDTWDE